MISQEHLKELAKSVEEKIKEDHPLRKYFFVTGLVFLVFIAFPGCSTTVGSEERDMIYKVLNPEPEWIRNGEPIEFEGELWYPSDNIDILTDSEVFPLSEYRGVPFYLQKVDVRPFDVLYTKFGRNKFRVFTTKKTDDTSQRAF